MPKPTTHYLDAINGNDAWNGRSSQFNGRHSGPWRTLDHARSKAKEGDTVILQSGNYGAFKESTSSGQAFLLHRKKWITYKAAPGHSPVLTGIDISNSDNWGGTGDGSSYLVFDGLQIKNPSAITSLINVTRTNYVKILNCTIMPETSLYGAQFSDADHLTVKGCDFYKTVRSVKLSGTCDDFSITRNAIH